MADEPASWLSTDDLVAWLQLDADAADPATPAGRVVQLVRRAAAGYCQRVRGDLFVPTYTDPLDPTTPVVDVVLVDSLGGDVQLAGILAAGRLWARRSSPAGLASFGEFGAAEIIRLDPDVDRLLGLGRHAAPAVG